MGNQQGAEKLMAASAREFDAVSNHKRRRYGFSLGSGADATAVDRYARASFANGFF